MPTLRELLIETERAFPTRVAARGAAGEMTYGELSRRVELLAEDLREMGLAGRRIGILLPNGIAFPVALHGVLRDGGSVLLLNPLSTPREIAEQMADAGVRSAVSTEQLAPLLPSETTAVLLDESGAVMRFSGDGRGPGSHGAPEPARALLPSPDDEAVVIFTSGMQGRSRGAVLTHRNLVANLRATAEVLALEADDRVLGVLPYAHAFGLTVCLNAPLAIGGMLLPMTRFTPGAALDALEAEEVTLLCGVPAMFVALLSAAEKRGGTLRHRLRVALSGGAPLPLEVARRWEERFGIPLRQGYGLTEAAPVCLFNRLDRPNRIGALGEPLPGVEISIRDPAGMPLGPGEVGELWVRGPNVFAGYLDETGPTSPVDGWLATGDLAILDGGVVRFAGILKQMFTRNGFNVYPQEVRRVLKEDPRIAEVHVSARPDPERDNEVVVTVVATPGTGLREEDVRELCSKQLATYKRPSTIRVIGGTLKEGGGEG